MNNLKEDIIKLIEDINYVSDLYYKQMEEEANLNLNKILFATEDIIANLINQNASLDVSKFNGILYEALNAMQNKDTILLADILKYELVNQFESVLPLI